MAVQRCRLLHRIKKHDANGHVFALILAYVLPPLSPNPAVLRRCAASARFLREMVQQVQGTAQMNAECVQMEASDPVLQQWKVPYLELI